jgi:putative transposase
MSHSLIKIWIHGIWGTKGRLPLIDPDFENKLHTHIKEHIEKDFGCKVRIIGGTKDHIHILFLLNQNCSILEIIKNAKGESSHWINQNNLTKEKFCWQTGYGVFSVSESLVGGIEKYITNQKEHHKKVSYKEEVELFVKKYGMNGIK